MWWPRHANKKDALTQNVVGKLNIYYNWSIASWQGLYMGTQLRISMHQIFCGVVNKNIQPGLTHVPKAPTTSPQQINPPGPENRFNMIVATIYCLRLTW